MNDFKMEKNRIESTRKILDKELKKIEKKGEQKTHGLRPADYKVNCGVCKRQVRKAFTVMDLKKNIFVCIQCFFEHYKKRKI